MFQRRGCGDITGVDRSPDRPAAVNHVDHSSCAASDTSRYTNPQSRSVPAHRLIGPGAGERGGRTLSTMSRDAPEVSRPDFEQIIGTLADSDVPDELLMLGGFLYADDRFTETRRVWERAFAIARAQHDDLAAARLAIALIDLHSSVLGNPAAANGWRARALRTLERVGPCVEWGYFEIAVIACARPDAMELMAATDRALALAEEYGDRNLEVRALAESGLALVSQGRVIDGFARLDEALAIVCSGETEDVSAVGRAFCAMLSSCERANELARAEEWIRLVNELVLDRLDGRPRILHTHCTAAYGAVLCNAGRWDEAEAAMLAVLGPFGSKSLLHRVDTTARLAHLRIVQGRLDEAAALLAPHEDRPAVALPMAELHLRRGEPNVAATIVRTAAALLVADVTRRLPLLALLVEAEIAHGDIEAARAAVAELEIAAATIGVPTALAESHMAQARVTAASGDHEGAVAHCRTAGEALSDGVNPMMVVTMHRLHAESLIACDDRAGAITEARAALAIAQRLGATTDADRIAALLRTLGVTSRPRVDRGADESVASLTTREREVLGLLPAGATNAEIGARLFISAKTVEHHVGRILAKLGVRSRAEAAAIAVAAARAEADGGSE